MKNIKISKSIHQLLDNSLSIYLKDLYKFKTYTKDEEKELFQRYYNGDLDAYEEIIKSNLRFVVTVAKQYQKQGLALVDLIEEGNYGLIVAVDKFDLSKDMKFISYAVWWIRQSIINSINKNNQLIRIPDTTKFYINKCKKVYAKYFSENQITPTIEDIAEMTDLRVKDVKKLMSYDQEFLSLFDDSHDDKHPLIETVKDNNLDINDELSYNELQRELIKVIDTLPEREAIIIKLFFGITVPKLELQIIGKMMNMSSERVRQLKEKGIKHLQKNKLNKIKYLKEWL